MAEIRDFAPQAVLLVLTGEAPAWLPQHPSILHLVTTASDNPGPPQTELEDPAALVLNDQGASVDALSRVAQTLRTQPRW